MDTMEQRRGGVFPTPLSFAKKACEYLEKIMGTSQMQSGGYRLWDMAAGTGHLELFLPKKMLKYCYLSTREQEDVQHLEKKFPDATAFQYDYLNDDVEQLFDAPTPILTRGCSFSRKMPDALRQDLANPEIQWIILVNPPYATAQEAGLKGTSKKSVSDTKIRKRMHAEGLGEVSRELYVQFLYRIMNEFTNRKAILGLFSPLKYLISANYQKFRDNVFHATFQSGFVFSSENFAGTSKTSHFPVSFILWDIHQGKNVAEQEMHLDILDSAAQQSGTKTVKPANRNEFLSRWIKRPRGTKIFPPFGSALTVKPDNVDTRNRIAEGFLASLMCPGNELQNQQQTAFLSGPQASAGAISVTPDNFEQAVVVFAARRIPKDSWVNHVDQLMCPNRELSPQFIGDCAVWSLFDHKNQTVAMRNVIYRERVYQVVNHFFPFPLEVCNPHPNPPPTGEGTFVNSFVADWLAKQTLSDAAQDVLTAAKEVYRFYFANGDRLPLTEFKIETDDAGWYQIYKALRAARLGMDWLADLKERHDALKATILPQLYDYGIVT
ncbi:MAG: hypothetical protein LBI05_08945 [Planctomycetaceae bacterium]|jgi:hypothetical protein|nr:hypothetical protein [Planctomycetaceae bacterium]